MIVIIGVDVDTIKSDGDEHESKVEQLHEELSAEKPCRKIVKFLMKTTFPSRRMWILDETPTIDAVMESFHL